MDACLVMPPGFALFPDKGQCIIAADRQNSDSCDGFSQPNGCQYRDCGHAQVFVVICQRMRCAHRVCKMCSGNSAGLCKTCMAKERHILTTLGTQKQGSRKTRYVQTDQLHLTKLPEEANEIVDEEEQSRGSRKRF